MEVVTRCAHWARLQAPRVLSHVKTHRLGRQNMRVGIER